MLKKSVFISLALTLSFLGFSQSKKELREQRRFKRDSITYSKDTMHYNVVDGYTFIYPKVKTLSWVRYIPKDWVDLVKTGIQKESLPWLGVIALTTIATLPADDELIDASRQSGTYLNISKTRSMDDPLGLKIGNQSLKIGLPSDGGAALYFIGDGLLSVMISGGLYTHALITKDNRSRIASASIMECMLAMGLVTQTIKRTTGRQSPFIYVDNGGKPGGEWAAFPSFKDYSANTGNYDAFPSGHMATAMATLTVLTQSYPNKRWIKFLGYPMLGLLGYQMMNNSVHWFSDYPLAIGIGYVIGKNSVERRRKTIRKSDGEEVVSWRRDRWLQRKSISWIQDVEVSPTYVQGKHLGLGFTYRF